MDADERRLFRLKKAYYLHISEQTCPPSYCFRNGRQVCVLFNLISCGSEDLP